MTPLLKDENPRVRFQAALTLGKISDKDALEPVLQLLRENADKDPYLRHAGVMALTGLADVPALLGVADDASPAVRMGVLLALRRKSSPEVARFLSDEDPRLVLEAARAINDVPIEAAFPRLASFPVQETTPQPILRRVVNANVRLGGAEQAQNLATLAAREDVPEAIRVEAIQALADWKEPSGRDRVMGLWRPIAPRSADPAAEAALPVLTVLLKTAPDRVRRAAAQAAERLGIRATAPALIGLVEDREQPAETRIESLKALERIGDENLTGLVRKVAADAESGPLRIEALRILADRQPGEAVPTLEIILRNGTTAERQGAFATLGGLKNARADRVLSQWLDRLLAGEVTPEVQLDLIEAAMRHPAPEIQEKLARYQNAKPTDDLLAAYREALQGGDAERGSRIFHEKAEVSCLRCHKINGQGGEVGPDLTGIGKRQQRDYLLESIVTPNKTIAEGFETLIVATVDGEIVAGVVKDDKGDTLKLMTPEAKLIEIPKSEIDEQKRGESAMPEDVIKNLSRSELRDLVEFLAGSK